MRRAIAVAAVAVAVLVSGCASTATANGSALIKDLLIPTPLGIILKASTHFIERNRAKVYYVQVESRGRDFEEAKNRALRVATEHAVGVVISSQRVVDNHEVVRNEIVAHSSGYVHDWQTVSEQRTGGEVKVVLDVWVSYLHLSERIVVKAEGSGNFDGEKLADARQSFQRQQATGMLLLDQVLRDYPQRAYDIRVQKTTGYAEGAPMQVEIETDWNSKYVGDLVTAIEQTTRPMSNWGAGWRAAPDNRVISVKMPDKFFIKFGAYDERTFGLFHQHFLNDPATIQLTMRGADGSRLWSSCYEFPTEAVFSSSKYAHLHVAGNGGAKSYIKLEPRAWIRETPAQLEDSVRRTRRIEATMVRRSQCDSGSR